jgi:hypothetical protein
MTPAAPHVPRVVALLAVVGLAIAANRFWPGTLQAVIALVVLYVALTHSSELLGLVGMAPAGLASAFHNDPAHAGGGRKP